MAEYWETHNFKSHRSGDTFKGKSFTFSAHPASDINKVELITHAGQKLSSDDGGITITDVAAWAFTIEKQIISWPPMTYKYDLVITMANGDVRTYIKGSWQIVN